MRIPQQVAPLEDPVLVRKRIGAWDSKILELIAARESARLDRVMAPLGRSADHGVLWFAVAVGLGAARGKWSRRAALRGIASLALASTTANVLGKQMVGRHRPEATARPGRPQARPPRTTSFPSGHAASAAAFATGAALEIPALALPVGGLAALVGASRVVTRVHYPSDVAAGFVIGTAAGLLTLRWWPRRPKTPAAAARPRRDAPAVPTGAGLVMVVNSSAGTASQDLADSLGESLPEAEIIVASADDDLSGIFTKAAERATILGVAGGDGTVRLAAGLASEAGLPLLVVPAGTFNHFAADLGVRSADEAVAALQAGDSVLVDLATADQEVFLNTASTGVYCDLVIAREQLEPELGKWPAVMVALVRVLRSSKPVELLVNGKRRRVWLLFAGNCRYEPSGAAPTYRPELADGTLDVRLVDGSQPMARTRLVAAVLLGTLGRCRVYKTWSAATLRLATPDGSPVQLSLDGETTESLSSIRLTKHRKGLLVYRPSVD
jgi:diacylglycerol kinase family enzyme/membrane-associated phospholipid phosphatase